MPKTRWLLKEKITERFRTQELFAHELGVVDSYVSKVVRGFRTPLWENRGKDIAKALHLTKKQYLKAMGE